MTAGIRYFGPDTPLFVPYSTREFPSASLLKTPQPKPTMPSASSEAATTPRPKVSIPCRPRFPKRLRSCLSPSRTPSSSSGICTPESRPASRATSFSSEVSLGVGSDGYSVDGPHDGQWKRSKSVRWEGEDEDDGASVVTVSLAVKVTTRPKLTQTRSRITRPTARQSTIERLWNRLHKKSGIVFYPPVVRGVSVPRSTASTRPSP